MAQVTGGSDFDGVWEEWSNASLMLLREASDRFAKAGENAIAADVVVASLLGVLAMPRPTNFYWGRPKWPPRFFDGTVQASSSVTTTAQSPCCWRGANLSKDS